MRVIPINLDTSSKYQSLETSITIGRKTLNVRIELRYLNKTDKWYLSMYDRQGGESYFLYVPVVAFYDSINNLIQPFMYKGIGFVVCAPLQKQTSSQDPRGGNLNEFGIAWGDSYV